MCQSKVYAEYLNEAGWFIPPYVRTGLISEIVQEYLKKDPLFTENDLENLLSKIYCPEHLASMVLHRYPEVPYVNEYKMIIDECVEAHFLGLNHIAVTGLLPIIEGVGLKIENQRKIKRKNKEGTRSGFKALAEDCKIEVINNQIGAVDEIICMLDAYINFLDNQFYANSKKFTFPDNTNRHGILHGSYSDDDYGRPLNFYKTISAIDFLCFIISLTASISFFAPESSQKSIELTNTYRKLQAMR